jgi:hypothetical protein
MHLCAGNGARAARHLLQWSGDQGCPDRAAFVAAMREAFAIHCDIHSEEGVNLDGVLKQVRPGEGSWELRGPVGNRVVGGGQGGWLCIAGGLTGAPWEGPEAGRELTRDAAAAGRCWADFSI